MPTLKLTIEAAFKDEWKLHGFNAPYNEDDEYRDALFAAISHGVLKYLSENASQIQTQALSYGNKHNHVLAPFTVMNNEYE